MTVLTDIVTGAVFGSALTISGVYKPAVIISQMQLRNFHMLQSFLTASAASALIIQFATKTGHCPTQTRSPRSFGRLPPYLGNVAGGLLIGTGMALTGACPGTLFVQGSVGILSGLYTGLGGLLGGLAFVPLAPLLRYTSASTASSKPQANGPDPAVDGPARQPVHSIAAKLGVETTSVLVAYEALCTVVVGLAAAFAPTDPTYLNPILGGLAIGGAQALSILVSRKTIGVSTVYGQLGQDFWGIVRPATHAKASSHSAIWFVVGICVGAKALAMQMPMLVPSGGTPQIGRLALAAGGALMVFGARMAGGCTSGHGISGMAALSVVSVVTVAAMFAGGIGWKMVIG